MDSECGGIRWDAAGCGGMRRDAARCGEMRRDGREEQNKPRKHGVNTLSFMSFAIFLEIILRRDAAGCGGMLHGGRMRRDAAGCDGMKEKNKIDLENTV